MEPADGFDCAPVGTNPPPAFKVTFQSFPAIIAALLLSTMLLPAVNVNVAGPAELARFHAVLIVMLLIAARLIWDKLEEKSFTSSVKVPAAGGSLALTVPEY